MVALWSGWLWGGPVPWHEFIDAGQRPAVHEAGQQAGEVVLRLDAVQLAGLDQEGDGRAVCPLVAAGDQGFLSANTNRLKD